MTITKKKLTMLIGLLQMLQTHTIHIQHNLTTQIYWLWLQDAQAVGVMKKFTLGSVNNFPLILFCKTDSMNFFQVKLLWLEWYHWKSGYKRLPANGSENGRHNDTLQFYHFLCEDDLDLIKKESFVPSSLWNKVGTFGYAKKGCYNSLIRDGYELFSQSIKEILPDK